MTSITGMTKSTKRIITLINSTVVLLLLIFTIVLLFMANSPQKTIFGKQVRIISNVKIQNSKPAETYLILLNTNSKANIKKGNLFLYNGDDGLSIMEVSSVENKKITYTDKNDKDVNLDISDTKFMGQVTYKSKFLGNLFNIVASKENISLSFIFIFGIFITSMLCLAITYMIYAKRFSENTADMPALSNPENSDESIFENEDIEEADSVEQLELEYIPLGKEKISQTENIAKTEPDSPPITTPKTFDEENNSGYKELFDKFANELSVPPYTLSDEDVPSIDSIIASIDRQFDSIDTEDSDMKIFTPKNDEN